MFSPMRAVLAALLCLAGCLEPSGPEGKPVEVVPHDTKASAVEFWFVEVRGRYDEAPRNGTACAGGYPSPPQLDLEARTIRFLNERFDLNATVFLVVGITATTPCSGLRTTVLPSSLPYASGTFLGFGDLGFGFHDNGTVEVLARFVPEGQSATFNRTGQQDDRRTFQANLTVVNHGMWQKDWVTMAPSHD